MKNDWSKYSALRDSGLSPPVVWRHSQVDGLNWMESVRMIRRVFHLSLKEAKEVKLQAEGVALTLEDYQRDVILPALEKAESQEMFDRDD